MRVDLMTRTLPFMIAIAMSDSDAYRAAVALDAVGFNRTVYATAYDPNRGGFPDEGEERICRWLWGGSRGAMWPPNSGSKYWCPIREIAMEAISWSD